MYELTDSDLEILEAIKNVVDGIAAMWGEHTEVLLHSLDTNNPSVIKIQNGHITGRDVGAPITNIAIEKLNQGKDVSEAYITRSPDGKTLRSVTTVIRNRYNQPIGLLCINSNLDAPFQSLVRSLIPEYTAAPANVTNELFARSNEEMLLQTIEGVQTEVLEDPTIPPSKRSREIVEKLYEQGLFELKDSAQIAAKGLDISIHTIYRHLRMLKGTEAC
ncbi:helix-turn-helix transcriptional regulator [Vibrio marisflavi]|uniref:Transcriptional regulator DauR n=1 Tax=Vibrio marisflavi CECT 7928 TaxID=634439 RepID=A0ABN8E1U3_9VIBR|nr:PAS domain-containing protein [Vibrio marisflavi]CAH0537597.1 Transcriptional regulator DauR [Vibrio marisflavi CECT 7928]